MALDANGDENGLKRPTRATPEMPGFNQTAVPVTYKNSPVAERAAT